MGQFILRWKTISHAIKWKVFEQTKLHQANNRAIVNKSPEIGQRNIYICQCQNSLEHNIGFIGILRLVHVCDASSIGSTMESHAFANFGCHVTCARYCMLSEWRKVFTVKVSRSVSVLAHSRSSKMALNLFQLQIDELHSYHVKWCADSAVLFVDQQLNLFLSLALFSSFSSCNQRKKAIIDRITMKNAPQFVSCHFSACIRLANHIFIEWVCTFPCTFELDGNLKTVKLYLATHLVSSFQQFIANDSFLSLKQLIRLKIYSFYVQQ